ncbi:MAG: CBS domain-containing protein [Candidatus Bathyarchaeota archaeon]
MVLEITSRMLVREAMSSPVISIHEDASVVELADTMKTQRVGAIIVVNKQSKPVGIVTERDIVTRVVAGGRTPKAVIAKEIMSSPLRMVEPDMKLMDVMSLMDKLNVRRLGVIYKGDLVGIVSDRDIIRLVPTIVEIMRSRGRSTTWPTCQVHQWPGTATAARSTATTCGPWTESSSARTVG